MSIKFPFHAKVSVNGKPLVFYSIEKHAHGWLKVDTIPQTNDFTMDDFRFLTPFSQTKYDDKAIFEHEVEKQIVAVMEQSKIKEVFPHYIIDIL